MIYCTCHNDTTDRFTDILDDVHVVDMDAVKGNDTRAACREELTVKDDGFCVF